LRTNSWGLRPSRTSLAPRQLEILSSDITRKKWKYVLFGTQPTGISSHGPPHLGGDRRRSLRNRAHGSTKDKNRSALSWGVMSWRARRDAEYRFYCLTQGDLSPGIGGGFRPHTAPLIAGNAARRESTLAWASDNFRATRHTPTWPVCYA